MRASSVAWALLSGARLAQGGPYLPRYHVGLPRDAGLDITLSLFTDNVCKTPSTSNPQVTLGLNVCAATDGLESFAFPAVPCSSGTVQYWTFDDGSCTTTSSLADEVARYSGDCYGTFKAGTAVAALMFTCDADQDEIEPSPPTSSTSIAVGEVAGASTPAPSAVTSSTPSTSSMPTGTGGNGAAATTSSSSTGWNSLDYGARVGIIVALVVGIPPILIGLLVLYRKS